MTLVGFSSVKDVGMIQSVLKSFVSISIQFIFIIDLGKIHIESIYIDQPERESLGNRYSSHATHARSDN